MKLQGEATDGDVAGGERIPWTGKLIEGKAMKQGYKAAVNDWTAECGSPGRHGLRQESHEDEAIFARSRRLIVSAQIEVAARLRGGPGADARGG